jgi:ABC-2 type transport system ATP-binding protein
LKDIILEKKEEGKVIIFSTHLMDFAEKLSDHIAMIDHGKIILQGSLGTIKSQFAQKNVTLEAEGDLSFLDNVSFVEKVENFGNSVGIRVKEATQTQDLLKLLVQNNVKVNRFAANEISLHEIFVTLAGKDSKDAK